MQESAGSASQGIDRRIYGAPVFLTSQLSITETQGTSNVASTAYLYDASQIVAVRREGTSIEVDSSRRFNEDMSEIRAISRWDLVVPNPEAVVRIVGILASPVSPSAGGDRAGRRLLSRRPVTNRGRSVRRRRRAT
jgi:HK97 family phage major capsid protein